MCAQQFAGIQKILGERGRQSVSAAGAEDGFLVSKIFGVKPSQRRPIEKTAKALNQTVNVKCQHALIKPTEEVALDPVVFRVFRTKFCDMLLNLLQAHRLQPTGFGPSLSAA